MKCPVCFNNIMMCDIYHYTTEIVEEYFCTKCGYTERHHHIRANLARSEPAKKAIQ
jgi:C4-type Zn-finger protein